MCRTFDQAMSRIRKVRWCWPRLGKSWWQLKLLGRLAILFIALRCAFLALVAKETIQGLENKKGSEIQLPASSEERNRARCGELGVANQPPLFILASAKAGGSDVGLHPTGTGQRIDGVRSIQFRRCRAGLEMQAILRMAPASILPPANRILSGHLFYRTKVVGVAGWIDLGSFEAFRANALGGGTDLVLRMEVKRRDRSRLVGLLSFATEAFVPYSGLEFQLDAQISEPKQRGSFWSNDRLRKPREPERWTGFFLASKPPPDAPQIFQSPDMGVLASPTAGRQSTSWGNQLTKSTQQP